MYYVTKSEEDFNKSWKVLGDGGYKQAYKWSYQNYPVIAFEKTGGADTDWCHNGWSHTGRDNGKTAEGRGRKLVTFEEMCSRLGVKLPPKATLNNWYVDTKGPEGKKVIQRLAFKAGMKWCTGSKEVEHLGGLFILVSCPDSGGLCHDGNLNYCKNAGKVELSLGEAIQFLSENAIQEKAKKEEKRRITVTFKENNEIEVQGILYIKKLKS